MKLYDWALYIGLPAITLLLTWAGGKWKRRAGRRDSTRDTIRVNAEIIEANGELLDKVGKLQKAIVEIMEVSKDLKSKLLEMEIALSLEKKTNSKLNTRILKLETIVAQLSG